MTNRQAQRHLSTVGFHTKSLWHNQSTGLYACCSTTANARSVQEDSIAVDKLLKSRRESLQGKVFCEAAAFATEGCWRLLHDQWNRSVNVLTTPAAAGAALFGRQCFVICTSYAHRYAFRRLDILSFVPSELMLRTSKVFARKAAQSSWPGGRRKLKPFGSMSPVIIIATVECHH
jgi:hypothetical protein